jgi:hypothetical protein
MAPSGESTDDVRYDIALTRQEMTVTLEELGQELAERKAALKARTVDRLDVAAFAREHPMVALAVALGAGALLAGTGADEKAAGAVARGAKAAPGKLAEAAKAVPGAVAGAATRALHLKDGDAGEAPGAPTVTAAREVERDEGLIAGGLSGLLRKALAPVLDEMERAARQLGEDLAGGSRPAHRVAFDAGADVPRDVVPPSTYGLAESASTGRPPRVASPGA